MLDTVVLCLALLRPFSYLYDSARASLHEIETEMEKRLDCRFADDCRSVYMRYAGLIVMDVYMRGVMEGARLHYAIVSRELPYKLDEQ